MFLAISSKVSLCRRCRNWRRDSVQTQHLENRKKLPETETLPELTEQSSAFSQFIIGLSHNYFSSHFVFLSILLLPAFRNKVLIYDRMSQLMASLLLRNVFFSFARFESWKAFLSMTAQLHLFHLGRMFNVILGILLQLPNKRSNAIYS